MVRPAGHLCLTMLRLKSLGKMACYNSPTATKSDRLFTAENEKEGEMFHVLSWIFFGMIVGVVAKFLMPGRDPGGFIVTILLGIAGAFIGGFLAQLVGWYGPQQQAGYLMSVFGAILLLWLYRRFMTSGTSGS